MVTLRSLADTPNIAELLATTDVAIDICPPAEPISSAPAAPLAASQEHKCELRKQAARNRFQKAVKTIVVINRIAPPRDSAHNHVRFSIGRVEADFNRKSQEKRLEEKRASLAAGQQPEDKRSVKWMGVIVIFAACAVLASKPSVFQEIKLETSTLGTTDGNRSMNTLEIRNKTESESPSIKSFSSPINSANSLCAQTLVGLVTLVPMYWKELTPTELRKRTRNDFLGLFAAETLNYVVSPYLDLVSLSYMTVDTANTLSQLEPVLVVVVARYWFKQRTDWWTIANQWLVVVGIIVAVTTSPLFGLPSFEMNVGVLYKVISSLSYTSSVLFQVKSRYLLVTFAVTFQV